jgi:hypothetical protein
MSVTFQIFQTLLLHAHISIDGYWIEVTKCKFDHDVYWTDSPLKQTRTILNSNVSEKAYV